MQRRGHGRGMTGPAVACGGTYAGRGQNRFRPRKENAVRTKFQQIIVSVFFLRKSDCRWKTTLAFGARVSVRPRAWVCGA